MFDMQLTLYRLMSSAEKRADKHCVCDAKNPAVLQQSQLNLLISLWNLRSKLMCPSIALQRV